MQHKVWNVKLAIDRQHEKSLKSHVELATRAWPIGYIIVLGYLEQQQNVSEPPGILSGPKKTRSQFFGSSREPQTSRTHVTRALSSDLRLRFTFVRLDHAPEISGLSQGFLHPETSQFHV